MIKLSDVQVRAQYRIRVRDRLMVLEYASGHGPTAAGRRFGVSARTVRRWRARWRAAGVDGLVPRYPRPRLRDVIEFIRRDLGVPRLRRTRNAFRGSSSSSSDPSRAIVSRST